jgi:hypothetical protein
MAAGQDLDRLGKLTVTRDPSVLVPIGADQVSQHPGITSIRLGASLAMAVTVAVDRSRVDPIDLVAGRYQRTDQQATVSLHPDQDLRWVLHLVGQHGLQPGQPSTPSGIRRLVSSHPSWSSTTTS